ncbi:MAG: RluA family pseudouridine synthase [Acidimicrobiia bacterium]
MERHAVPVFLDGERADKVVAVLGGLSRALARRVVDDGGVLVDGEPITPRRRLSAGDTIEFELPDIAELLWAEDVDFTVRYEDDHLLVVDKPAGLVVHPGAGLAVATLASGLLHRYPEIRGVGEDPRWGIVHRLDKDTSGLLVVARTQPTHDALSKMIAAHAVERGYIALVDGIFDAPRGTIDAPIGPDPAKPTRRMVTPFGRPARTHYRRVQESASEGVSLLEVQLETGRTHQIRVHLSAIGHPVIGDRWYGKPARVDSPRVFLHAARLAFDHPMTGARVEVESLLPADLQTVLDAL